MMKSVLSPWMKAQLVIGAVVVALLAMAPKYLSDTSALFFIMFWVVMAESFNMFAGLTGYVNFGHVVFYAMGGYTAIVLMIDGLSPIVAVLAGGGASALLAVGISLPTTRLRGAYFAIATLSINEAAFVIFDNWGAVNSATGLTLPISDYLPTTEYYAMLAIAAACVATAYLMTRSGFGVALRAIRQQEATANSIGINAALYKMIALVVSGAFAGLAGAVAIWQISIVDPPSAFNVTITIESISMAMLGGLGTVVGPVLGAPILYEVIQYLDFHYPNFYLVPVGVIIIAVVLLIPAGIVGAAKRIYVRAWSARGGKGNG